MSSSPTSRSPNLAWLTTDWVSLFVALALAVLVRAGVLAVVPW
jgi:hypothetical protein